ncbi:hypothetical protein HAX54_031286 [Datura stramonium]|uniref:Uncharacterized protein n=1 Tax=Datura stramonium TaxID=4076 RepID=A0ABS8VA77_DATST|nr:hypothetical protein [Datura stramonium]
MSATPKAINSLYMAELIQPNSTFRRMMEDKENKFQWVASIIAIGQPQWASSPGNTTKVPIEVAILIACIMDHIHINVGEIVQINSKKGQADGVITLDTRTNKDAPALKRAKGTENRTQPPPFMPSNNEGQVQAALRFPSLHQLTFSNSKMAQAHESQDFEVLENEISLRKDMDTLTIPPPAATQTPPESVVVTSQPGLPKPRRMIGGWGTIVHQKWCLMRRYIIDNHQFLQCSQCEK